MRLASAGTLVYFMLGKALLCLAELLWLFAGM